MGTAKPAGPLAAPNPESRGNARQHSHDEKVLKRTERTPPSEQREMESILVDGPKRLDDGREQDYESPENEEMHESWHRPLQEFSLTKHDYRLFPQLGHQISRPPVVGPPEAKEPHELDDSAGEGRQSHGDEQRHRKSLDHPRPPIVRRLFGA
jgi:hypothetical protein